MQRALYNVKHLKNSIVKGVASCLMSLNSSLDDYNIIWLYIV
jgi:hypothetical protein